VDSRHLPALGEVHLRKRREFVFRQAVQPEPALSALQVYFCSVRRQMHRCVFQLPRYLDQLLGRYRDGSRLVYLRRHLDRNRDIQIGAADSHAILFRANQDVGQYR
jgi:hypothetical protein